jgi:hypothetical protein
LNRSGPVAGAALLAAVSACSSGPHSIADSTYRGLPPGRAAVTAVPVEGALATATKGRLALTFWGSSDCPTVPTRLRVLNSSTVSVTVSRNYHHDCDADLGPTTSEIEVDTHRVVLDSHLAVRLTGAGFPPGQVIRPTR